MPTTARNLTILACLSLSLLTACGNPNNGYYDDNGNFVKNQDTPYNTRERPHSSPLGSDGVPYRERYTDPRGRTYYNDRNNAYRPAAYDRMGYYDSRGYYVNDDAFSVAPNMFPPRGMCRVWFTTRPASAQPPVESCNNIRNRVPEDAYVIFGG